MQRNTYNTFYSISKAEIIINESNIDDVFESLYSTVISNTKKSLGKDSLLIISKYNPLARSSYIILPKKIRQFKKRFDEYSKYQ